MIYDDLKGQTEFAHQTVTIKLDKSYENFMVKLSALYELPNKRSVII